jgi:hypothetical protein
MNIPPEEPVFEWLDIIYLGKDLFPSMDANTRMGLNRNLLPESNGRKEKNSNYINASTPLDRPVSL